MFNFQYLSLNIPENKPFPTSYCQDEVRDSIHFLLIKQLERNDMKQSICFLFKLSFSIEVYQAQSEFFNNNGCSIHFETEEIGFSSNAIGGK